LPGYFYSTNKEGLWVHLYHSNVLNWKLENGAAVVLQQNTRYPWDGEITIRVDPAKKCRFALHLRIPDWCPNAVVQVNQDSLQTGVPPGSYHAVTREWKKGDVVKLTLAMPVLAVHGNPRLREDWASAAIQRGPVVYCLEGVDQPDFSIFDLVMPLDTVSAGRGFSACFEPELLGGIVTLKKDVLLYEPSLQQRPLYQTSAFIRPIKPATVTMIPYYAWANRGRSSMQVWIPYQAE
jgi:uncharacterized protein